uniref:Lipoprotein n=1 Tax=Schlesneria paludicola TaxID=360056 RepID=A0A7C4LMX2_9PLAN
MTIGRRGWRGIGIWAAWVLAGCNGPADSPPSPPPLPVAPAYKESASIKDQIAAAAEPREKQFQGITVTVPAAWEERAPANEFIQAEFRVNGEAGAARITMSSTGGGIEANLERWRGQFTRGPDDPEPKQTTLAVGTQQAVVLELFGTFRDGFSGGSAQPKSAMLGAAIPTGPATFFVKMTGPRETVLSQREAFYELVKTARLSD